MSPSTMDPIPEMAKLSVSDRRKRVAVMKKKPRTETTRCTAAPEALALGSIPEVCHQPPTRIVKIPSSRKRWLERSLFTRAS